MILQADYLHEVVLNLAGAELFYDFQSFFQYYFVAHSGLLILACKSAITVVVCSLDSAGSGKDKLCYAWLLEGILLKVMV